jgi:hypothetical protein
MAHEVSLNLNTNFVLHRDVVVEVKKDGEMLGKLLVSKGNIEWLPANHSVNKFRMSWSKFAEMMEVNGKLAKVR